MELTFLGGTSFRLKTKQITMIIDPSGTKEKADVVVFTKNVDGPKSKFEPANRDNTFVIDREGEYELGGVGIIVDRLESGKDNFLVRVNVDGVEIAHTGGLGENIDEKTKNKLTESAVMLVDIHRAVNLIKECEPYLAVLMGYENQESLENFLGSHKFDIVKRGVDKLKLDADSLPENTEVVVLNG